MSKKKKIIIGISGFVLCVLLTVLSVHIYGRQQQKKRDMEVLELIEKYEEKIQPSVEKDIDMLKKQKAKLESILKEIKKNPEDFENSQGFKAYKKLVSTYKKQIKNIAEQITKLENIKTAEEEAQRAKEDAKLKEQQNIVASEDDDNTQKDSNENQTSNNSKETVNNSTENKNTNQNNEVQNNDTEDNVINESDNNNENTSEPIAPSTPEPEYGTISFENQNDKGTWLWNYIDVIDIWNGSSWDRSIKDSSICSEKDSLELYNIALSVYPEPTEPGTNGERIVRPTFWIYMGDGPQ